MPKKIQKSIKFDLTTDERLTKSLDQSELLQKIDQLKEAKKSSASQFASEISNEETKLKQVSTTISNGYEYRDTICLVTYNDPKEGMKTTRMKDDPGNILDVEPMTNEELSDLLKASNHDVDDDYNATITDDEGKDLGI